MRTGPVLPTENKVGAKLAEIEIGISEFIINTTARYTTQSLDTRILRGGSAMMLPSAWYRRVYVRTDQSKKFYFSFNSDLSTSANHSARNYSFEPYVQFTPTKTINLSASFNYSDNRNDLQYVTSVTSNGYRKYILGQIDQQTMEITFRVDFIITPELSIQYYGSPFATVGKYSQFKRVSQPNAGNYYNRFITLQPELNGNTYEVSENNSTVVDYKFGNPNFNFSQFRSNLVFRWEYRPGSQLNFVWSQDRTAYTQPGNRRLNDGMSKIKSTFPDNIFLIKFNYWFSL